jgi:hypothetical protein
LLKVKKTNPGTFEFEAELKNETGLDKSAFAAHGKDAIEAKPKDRSQPGAGPRPAGVSMWNAGQPPDRAVVKCVKVEGIALKKHGEAEVEIKLDFALKDVDGWGANAGTDEEDFSVIFP